MNVYRVSPLWTMADYLAFMKAYREAGWHPMDDYRYITSHRLTPPKPLMLFDYQAEFAAQERAKMITQLLF